MIRRAAIVGMAIFALGSCASVAKSTCTTDFIETGIKSDFQRQKYGATISRIDGMCGKHGYALDTEAYDFFWKREQSLYCTAEHALMMGEMGQSVGDKYKGQCANFNEPAFLANYERGKRLRPYTLAVNKWRELLGDRRSPLEQATADVQITEEQFRKAGIDEWDAVGILVADAITDMIMRKRWEAKLDEAKQAKFEFVRSGYGEGPSALRAFQAQRMYDYRRNAADYETFRRAVQAGNKLMAWANLQDVKWDTVEIDYRMPSFVYTGRWPDELGIPEPTLLRTRAISRSSVQGKFLTELGLGGIVGDDEDNAANLREFREAQLELYAAYALAPSDLDSNRLRQEWLADADGFRQEQPVQSVAETALTDAVPTPSAAATNASVPKPQPASPAALRPATTTSNPLEVSNDPQEILRARSR